MMCAAIRFFKRSSSRLNEEKGDNLYIVMMMAQLFSRRA